MTTTLEVAQTYPETSQTLVDDLPAGQVAEGISLRLGQVDRVFLLGDETQLTRVVVSVSDDGLGIQAADRERIWERFARLDDDRSRSSGRSGLRLASGLQLRSFRHSG
jgi:signal transduction histidine kinase